MNDGRVWFAPGTLVYEPDTDTWSESIDIEMYGHLTVMPDGRVWVLDWDERHGWLVDPATGEVTKTATRTGPEFEPALVATDDGTVMLVGGPPEPQGYGVVREDPVPIAALYDSNSDTWRSIEPPPIKLRYGWRPLAAPLPDGKVMLISGTYSSQRISELENTEIAIYDPQTNSWAKLTDLENLGTFAHFGVLKPLPDGRVISLSAGAWGTTKPHPLESSIYDPTTNNWLKIPSPTRLEGSGACPWMWNPNYSYVKVPVAVRFWPCGDNELGFNSVAIYRPNLNDWYVASLENVGGDLVALPDGRLFSASGGESFFGRAPEAWMLIPPEE